MAGKTLENPTAAGAADDLARFFIRPPLRCFHRDPNLPGAVCPRDAVRRRPGTAAGGAGFYCDVHSRPGDGRIINAHPFRRVTVTLAVDLSGTSFDASQAQAEAIARLERAVHIVGGVVTLHACHSAIGALTPPPARQAPPGATNGRRPASRTPPPAP